LVAILQLAFGGVGLLGLVNAAFKTELASDPISRKMYEKMGSGEMGTWMRVSNGVGLVLALLLLAAGFALLRRRAIGRTLTLVHAVSALIVNVVSTLIGPLLDELPPGFGPAGDIFKTTFRGAVFFGVGTGLVLPAAEWYLVTRPGVREVLQDG
jgi:hypothetical protein